MDFLVDRIRFYESLLGKGDISRDARNVSFKCPFCGKAGSEKKKLVIRTTDDTCHCWVCDFKSRSLIPLLRKIAPDRLQEYVDTFYKGSTKVVIEEREEKLKLPSDFQLLLTAIRDPDVVAMINFLKRRGLSEDDIWRNRLGISNQRRWHRRVIFPSFNSDGELNYYTGRAIDASRFPKYDAPPVDKIPIIFNELFIDWSKEVVLCEGPFDAVKCGDNAIPLLGSSLSIESLLFKKIVLNGTPVALSLDADMLDTKVPYIVNTLQRFDVSVRVVRVRTDPGDMTKEEFSEALSSAKTPDWSSFVLNKLKSAATVSSSI